MAKLSRSSARGRVRRAFTSITKVPDWFMLMIEGWRERSQLRRELDNLRQHGELDRTLLDCGMSPSDVSRLMAAHPRAAWQLAEMMQRLGIDRGALPRSPAVLEALRMMEWQCGECADWRKCRAWLASRGAAESYRRLCPNAKPLDDLRCSETSASSSSFGKPSGILVELEAAKGIDGAPV